MKIQDRFPEMLKLSSDFAKVELAKRIPTTNISEDMAKIRMGLTQTKNGIKQSKDKGDDTFEASMGEFAAEAESTKKKLEERIKKMENSFKELCAFLGESPPPKTKSDELFSTISRFVGQFKTATTKYKEKSERKAKAAQDAAKAAMKVKLKDATGDSPPSLATNNPRPPASKAQEEDCQSLLCQSLLVSAVPLEVLLVGEEHHARHLESRRQAQLHPEHQDLKVSWLSIFVLVLMVFFVCSLNHSNSIVFLLFYFILFVYLSTGTGRPPPGISRGLPRPRGGTSSQKKTGNLPKPPGARGPPTSRGGRPPPRGAAPKLPPGLPARGSARPPPGVARKPPPGLKARGVQDRHLVSLRNHRLE